MPLYRRPHLGPATKTASRTENTHLLDAFLGYVATFFHGRQQQIQNRTIAMSVRALQTSRTRRPLVLVSNWGTARVVRDATELRDGQIQQLGGTQPSRRYFHNYFVTHLPSSSLHPDSRSSAGPGHKLPRSASTPHTPDAGSAPAAAPPNMPSRDLTVVRIPLRSAKHHFGASNSRGQRVSNEDTYQAGTIHIPAFAKRVPISLVRHQAARTAAAGEGTSAASALGDPQVFYFGIFDGHGGSECSEFLRDELHGYIEQAAAEFGLKSSLKREPGAPDSMREPEAMTPQREIAHHIQEQQPQETVADDSDACKLESDLLAEYKRTIGGYFRRFRPNYFSVPMAPSTREPSALPFSPDQQQPHPHQPHRVTLESVLTYAFLRADLDFVTAQARKPDPDDPYVSDFPLNKDEILGSPHLPPSGHGIGGTTRFKGGSTASIALISTPTPAPFWHPAAHSTLVVAHVGDTRILLCETATGLPLPLTQDHRPSSPAESRRLTRYVSDSLVTDSFGEERIQGLANSRAFGDMQSKRIGVSAEPDFSRVDLKPAEFSFLVLASDGVSGTLSDQEIVDVIKEARTPEQGARKVVEYATEVSGDGDNATCLVVRLGGWERRDEGGVGSLGTREMREMRRSEALDPRRRGR
ncbi:protein serine/threonine phosphatase 2C [Parathielavia appendiculata]|uniref:Protein serine/threonine phosphatase 2C n=1 Tax=Parathielavia appendiculata TaxID=2587402 RepID=A0AAN6TSV7_9PEZI|nr:protein serine/threonine phosphatase 2C [Parathielavia appendiculata]